MPPAYQEARAADFQFWAQDQAYPSVRKQLLNYFPKQIYINRAYSYYISRQCISLKVKKGKLYTVRDDKTKNRKLCLQKMISYWGLSV